MESHKSSSQIHVKTLEEIRLEKAARLKDLFADAPETSSNKAANSEKPVLTTKDQCCGPLRTFSEVYFAKRKMMQAQQPSFTTETVPGRSQTEDAAAGSSPAAGSGPAASKPPGIRVKTLEEIRREKAARGLSKQVSKVEGMSDGETVVKKTRLLKISKGSLTGKNPTNTSLKKTAKIYYC